MLNTAINSRVGHQEHQESKIKKVFSYIYPGMQKVENHDDVANVYPGMTKAVTTTSYIYPGMNGKNVAKTAYVYPGMNY